MSRNSILILLGILVILAPFSGLPASIRTLLAIIFGVCVSAIGLSQRAREARHTAASVSGEAHSHQPSVETPPPPPPSISSI